MRHLVDDPMLKFTGRDIGMFGDLFDAQFAPGDSSDSASKLDAIEQWFYYELHDHLEEDR